MPVDVIVEQINSTFSCKNQALFLKVRTKEGCDWQIVSQRELNMSLKHFLLFFLERYPW